MKTITEQVEETKSLICASICKWLDKANKTDIKSLEDIQTMQDTMQEICDRCPLRRL
jgi:hypothetical protein